MSPDVASLPTAPPWVPPRWLTRGRGVAVAASLAAHAVVATVAAGAPHRVTPSVRRTVLVTRAPKAALPVPEVAATPAMVPVPDRPSKPSQKNQRSPRDVASPPPSMAGRAVTAKGDAEGPLDFTLSTGEGSYVGGVTSSQGVARNASATAGPSDAVKPLSAPVPSALLDRSAPARVSGAEWDCSSLFPTEAARDEAWVTLVVSVSVDGAPEAVAVLTDPGDGFGAAARACALRQRYTAARGPDGMARRGKTLPVRVHFSR